MRISASFGPSHSFGLEAKTVYSGRSRGRLRYSIRSSHSFAVCTAAGARCV